MRMLVFLLWHLPGMAFRIWWDTVRWDREVGKFFKEAKKIPKFSAKRRKDRYAQWAYYQDHPYCEVCLTEGRGQHPADDVHEILYRSQGGRCVSENEISTCRPNHDRMHFKKKPYLRREQLLEMKAWLAKGREEEIVFGAKGGLVHLQKEARSK